MYARLWGKLVKDLEFEPPGHQCPQTRFWFPEGPRPAVAFTLLRLPRATFAHMVAFDDDRRGFAHLHPGESIQPVDDSEDFVGSLTFGFRPPSSGHFRLWAQVRIGGEELFVPFDLMVDA